MTQGPGNLADLGVSEDENEDSQQPIWVTTEAGQERGAETLGTGILVGEEVTPKKSGIPG